MEHPDLFTDIFYRYHIVQFNAISTRDISEILLSPIAASVVYMPVRPVLFLSFFSKKNKKKNKQKKHSNKPIFISLFSGDTALLDTYSILSEKYHLPVAAQAQLFT